MSWNWTYPETPGRHQHLKRPPCLTSHCLARDKGEACIDFSDCVRMERGVDALDTAPPTLDCRQCLPIVPPSNPRPGDGVPVSRRQQHSR